MDYFLVGPLFFMMIVVTGDDDDVNVKGGSLCR
jgi:hypothetical protein